MKNQSAPILVSGSGSHLALLGAGASLNAKGNVIVISTDGTESQAPLQLPNWCCQDPTTGGAKEVVAVKGRYTANGLANGGPLTLAGTQYAKGIGTHAPSSISVRLGGNCSTFTAQVGVDDEMEDRGKVSFKVAVDGVVKYTSDLLTGTSLTVPVSVDVTGGENLTLQVTDAGDGVTSDHADWADARLTCRDS